MRTLSVITLAFATLLAPPNADAALVNLYRFDDQTNLGLDSIGGSNATNFGGVSFLAAGRWGGAASFDGIDDFFQAGVNVQPANMPNMTWGAWVRPTANNVNQGVLSNDDGGFDRGILINRNDGSDPFSWGAPDGSGPGATGTAPTTTDWTFLAASYDQTNATMTFYINAAEFTRNTFYTGAQAVFEIGHDPNFGTFLGGAVDSVFVFNETLDSTAIAAIRNDQTTITAVPEPSSLCFLALVGCGIATRRRFRRT